MENKSKSWIKKQEFAKDFEIIQCKKFDEYKDHKDDNCYVLIKIYKDTKEIGVAVCNYKNIILKEFRGLKSQDLYHTIFEYSNKNKLNWFSIFDHAAYLGKELKKAEFAIQNNTEYLQE